MPLKNILKFKKNKDLKSNNKNLLNTLTIKNYSEIIHLYQIVNLHYQSNIYINVTMYKIGWALHSQHINEHNFSLGTEPK